MLCQVFDHRLCNAHQPPTPLHQTKQTCAPWQVRVLPRVVAERSAAVEAWRANSAARHARSSSAPQASSAAVDCPLQPTRLLLLLQHAPVLVGLLLPLVMIVSVQGATPGMLLAVCAPLPRCLLTAPSHPTPALRCALPQTEAELWLLSPDAAMHPPPPIPEESGGMGNGGAAAAAGGGSSPLRLGRTLQQSPSR